MPCRPRPRGVARGGYADFVSWTRERYLTYTQLAIAEISVQIDTAELLARRSLATARSNYSGMDMDTRILLWRDWTYAMRGFRTAMDSLIKISATSGLRDDNPVQRAWRDVHAISSHVVMGRDVPAESFGLTELGLGRNEAYPAY